ncbi:MAG TPA: hypothetical protein VFK70_12970 [Vicinamibacteria bacterium]|nr:hypothetical protein [Vicinamibacteria bacterium]
MLVTLGIIAFVVALIVGLLAIWWYRRPIYLATAQIEIVTKDAARKEEPPPENI